MKFLHFPTELVLSVAEVLTIEDLSNLLLTCNKLALLLTPHLYNRVVRDKLPPLHWAAEHGLELLAELAILNGADIDKGEEYTRRTPLHLAAYYNRPAAIRILFKHGASLAAVDIDRMTPLHLAASLGKLEAIRELLLVELSAGIGDWMVTPATCVASKGNVACMKAFIDAGFDVNTRDSDGRTVFHWVFFGWVKNLEMLEYLLAQEGARAAIYAQDVDRITALHLAVIEYRAEHVRLLLRYGADMEVVDSEGSSPADRAASEGSVECMEALIEGGFEFTKKGQQGKTILHEAISNDVDMVEYLLGQDGAQMIINAQNSEGLTPLHLAVGIPFKAGNIRLLLRHGANMEVKDSEGDTPVHKAAYEGDIEYMRAFLDAGFDINTRGRRGRTILHCAATRSTPDMATYLLKVCFAPRPNRPLSYKPTIEQRPTVCKKRAMISLLDVDLVGLFSRLIWKFRGVKTHPTTPDGKRSPPRPLAAHNFGMANCANDPSEQLLGQWGGSIINAKDSEGSTPIHLATESRGSSDIMRKLVQYGADPEIVDGSGNTATHLYAFHHGEVDEL